MTTKSHVAMGAAVLVAAVLTLGLFGGRASPPAQSQPAVSAAPAASPGGTVAERPAGDDGPSATGMEHVPVFR